MCGSRGGGGLPSSRLSECCCGNFYFSSGDSETEGNDSIVRKAPFTGDYWGATLPGISALLSSTIRARSLLTQPCSAGRAGLSLPLGGLVSFHLSAICVASPETRGELNPSTISDRKKKNHLHLSLLGLSRGFVRYKTMTSLGKQGVRAGCPPGCGQPSQGYSAVRWGGKRGAKTAPGHQRSSRMCHQGVSKQLCGCLLN